MGRNDWKPGDVIRCHDKKDLMTYYYTLREFGYAINVDVNNLKITILENEANEQNND